MVEDNGIAGGITPARERHPPWSAASRVENTRDALVRVVPAALPGPGTQKKAIVKRPNPRGLTGYER